MMRPYRIAVFVAFVSLCLLNVIPVRADTGPKPTIEIKIVYQAAPIAITEALLLECSDSTCADARRLSNMPEGIKCPAETCYWLLYTSGPFFKLVVTFADRQRESNVFAKRAFNAQYTATVSETGLNVEENLVQGLGNFVLAGASVGSTLIPSLLVTILVETLVAAIYLRIARQPGRLLFWVPIINIITLPLLWLFVTTPLLFNDSSGGLKLLIGETAVVAAEAAFLHLISRKILKLNHAVILSVIMNLLSFAAGYLLAIFGL